VRSLGAGEVIDYTLEDFTKNGQTYDVIFDASATFRLRAARLRSSRGVFLPTDGLKNLALAVWTARVGDRKVVFKLPPKFTKQDVLFLKELMEAGNTARSSIDATHSNRSSKPPNTWSCTRRPETSS